jgi:hypothetical protein
MNGKSMKQISMAASWLTGLALVVMVVLGWVAYFTDNLSPALYGKVGLVAVSLVLLFAYFEWVRARMATVFAVAVAVMFVAVTWFQTPAVSKAQFQAVFLTNGQVYFGHLENATAKNLVLSDIYYLQSTPQNPQQGTSQTDQTSQANLTLVKLGNEIHGPQDKMVIKSDQVLFWENLKDNSKVVTAIKQNQNK